MSPIKHGHCKRGGKRSRAYRLWTGVINRCENENCDEYPRYGGRGIGMCDEWRSSFATFNAHILTLGPCPPGMSLDRKDNDRGYEPGNVRWATRKEQAQNRGGQRRNRLVTVQGKAMCLADAAKAAGLPMKTLHNRIIRGMSDEDACAAIDYRRFNHF
jgi:hypothetical protein